MKKLIVILIIINILMMSAYAQPITLIKSADQYYSVVYDEEGEATVTLLLTLKNSDDAAISNFTLEIPGIGINLIGVIQETTGYGSQVCTRWDTQCIEYGQGQTCVQYDYNGNCVKYQQPCLQESRVCVYYQTNYYTQPIYKRVQVQPVQLSNSVTLPIDLVSPVQPQGQTTLMIFYKADRSTVNLLGAHKFAFETAKIPYDSNTVRVAVNVQQDLILKGGSSQVNYLPNFDTVSKALAESDISGYGQEIQDYHRSVSAVNGLVKTATNLDPHESFTVNGVYSKSWLRLYWDRLLLLLVMLVIIGAMLNFGIHKFTAALTKTSKKTHQTFSVPFLGGLFTALGIVTLWILSFIVTTVMNNIAYGLGSLLGLILILLTLVLTMVALVAVPLYIGLKFDAATGLFTAVSILGWLFVMTILIFIAIAVLSTPIIRYF